MRKLRLAIALLILPFTAEASMLQGATPSNYTLPSGWSLVRTQDFEGTRPSSEAWGAWNGVVNTVRPHSGAKSIEGTYNSDQKDAHWELYEGNSGSFAEIYVSFYEYIESQALFNDEFFLTRFSVTSPFQEVMSDWFWASDSNNNGMFNGAYANLYTISQGVKTGRTARKFSMVPKGAWVQWEIHYRPNTSGSSDGFYRVYKDGSLFASVEGADLNGSRAMTNASVMVGGTYTKLVWMTDSPTCSIPSGCSSAPGIGTDYCTVAQGWSYQSFANPYCAPIDPPLASFYRYFDDIIVIKTGGSSGGDVSDPYPSQWSPAKNATGVPITNRTINFHIQDDTDVLTANGVVNIEGTNYTCSAGLSCTGNGTTNASITYTKGSDWSNSQQVDISTTGFRDSAGNVMATDTWHFTTVAASQGLNITTTTLPSGTLTVPYSQTVLATGGTTPYAFSVLSGALPDNLSISSGGVISGTPTVAGTFNVVIKVIDNVSATDNQALSIVVGATGNMSIVNSRYFADASGTPKFLVGYYDHWLSVSESVMNLFNGHQSWIIDNTALYGLNYTRISISVPQFSASTTPASFDNTTSLAPFAYSGGKADLSQWDADYWTALKAYVSHAAVHGISVHVGFFDGYGLRNPADGWAVSFWKLSNQTSSFFGNIDSNSNGDTDEDGEFYQTTAFTNNTGVGYYQKLLIDKTISELSGYSNVFYETGNELSKSPEAWTNAVRSYVATKTNKPITTGTCCSNGGCSLITSPGGWVSHIANTPAEVKSAVASIVGHGYPSMEDPDGPALMTGTSDDLRKSAWYSLTGGGFGWGGFSLTWENNDPPVTATRQYYQYLLQFLDNNAVRFWEMTPQQSLISTPTTNSLIANIGSQYLGYVLSGASVDITLGTGSYAVKYFDPVTGVTTTGTDTTGPATRTFNRPSGASDWAVFAYTATNPVYVTTTSLSAGVVGTPYVAHLAATGGIPSPYTWSIISGVLPPGLALSNDNVLGTPTTVGTYPFTVRAADSSGNSGTKALSITVTAAVPGGQVTVRIDTIEDTFINGGSPGTNSSSDNIVRVYQWPSGQVINRGLFKVTLGLQDNISIISATWYMYTDNASTHSGSGGTDPMRTYIYRVSDNVPVISTITWDVFDNTSHATLASAESYADVSLVPKLNSWTVTNAVTWAYANSSALYLALDGGLLGVADTNRKFTSMDGAAAFRPYLSVTYMQLVAPQGPSISAPGKMRVSKFSGKFK